MNTNVRRAVPKLLLSLAVFLGATVSHSLSSAATKSFTCIRTIRGLSPRDSFI